MLDTESSDVFTRLQELIGEIRGRLALVATESDGLKQKAAGSRGEARAWRRLIERQNGAAGPLQVAAEHLRGVTRSVTTLRHEIEVALSPAFFKTISSIDRAGRVPAFEMKDGESVALGVGPIPDRPLSLRFEPNLSGTCQVLGTDTIGMSLPLRFVSETQLPSPDDGDLWLAVGIRPQTVPNDDPEELRQTIRKFFARGPALCQAGRILDGFEPTFYRFQSFPDQEHFTVAPDSGNPERRPVCDPALAVCRHLRSLILNLVRINAAGQVDRALDVTSLLKPLSSSLGFHPTFFDAQVNPNVSLFARRSPTEHRPPVPLAPLGAFPPATPPWDLAVKLHESLLRERIIAKVNEEIEEFRRTEIDDDEELFADINAINFEPETDSIAILVDALIKNKKVFSVEDPITHLGVDVTMRVEVRSTITLRARFRVDGHTVKLDVDEESATGPDVSKSFSPDIVGTLSGGMNAFIDLVVALETAFRERIHATDDVFTDSAFDPIEPHVLADAIVVFAAKPRPNAPDSTGDSHSELPPYSDRTGE
jgi:hypothetical protein